MNRSKPDWLKVKIPHGQDVVQTRKKLERLYTICQSALCPNQNECYSKGIATFLILGDICTRSCGFCAVESGRPKKPDRSEPGKIAQAIKKLNLRYAVITSVTREDLPDGGASLFCSTIKRIRAELPTCRIEVLIPDFNGNMFSLAKIINQSPDVISHNIETVERLYPVVRKGAHYRRSVALIKEIKIINKNIKSKSGLMLGHGEKITEVIVSMKDLRTAHCDILTIGQYLQPTKKNLSVKQYLHPDTFEELKEIGKELGFSHVESGPLVRSSYHAEKGLMS